MARKNIPGHFTPRPTVEWSGGYRFQQRGWRVYVEDTETGEEVADFGPRWPWKDEPKTWNARYMTSKQLETAARAWLSGNPDFLGVNSE